jgi:hypothetical protein
MCAGRLAEQVPGSSVVQIDLAGGFHPGGSAAAARLRLRLKADSRSLSGPTATRAGCSCFSGGSVEVSILAPMPGNRLRREPFWRRNTRKQLRAGPYAARSSGSAAIRAGVVGGIGCAIDGRSVRLATRILDTSASFHPLLRPMIPLFWGHLTLFDRQEP